MSSALTHVIRNAHLYWKADRCGYTDRILEAGLYTEAEAKKIESNTSRTDRAVPLSSLRVEIQTAYEHATLVAVAAGAYIPVHMGPHYVGRECFYRGAKYRITCVAGQNFQLENDDSIIEVFRGDPAFRLA